MSTATAAAETATIIWGTTGAAFYCPGASGFAQGSPLAPILDVGGPGVLADPGPFLCWIRLPARPSYISRMSSLSSLTRAAPAGFIEPCPSPADTPPSGSNWIHEIKHDGYRLMARRDPVGIRLLTRRGNDGRTATRSSSRR